MSTWSASISSNTISGINSNPCTIAVPVEEIEDDIDWGLWNRRATKNSVLQGRTVEEIDMVRGEVCCMINDVNNGIHPNVVAAKYSVSVLVLIRLVARFAHLKVIETTARGEIPELFD